MNDLQKLCIEISTRLLKVATGNSDACYDVDYFTGDIKIIYVSFPLCYYERYDQATNEYITESILWDALSENTQLEITLEIYERYFKNK
jgi:hypothetical protein